MSTTSSNKICIWIRTLLCALLFAGCLSYASADNKDFIVVIDAGHGGKDSGALGKNSKEKDINLAVARRLAKEIESNFKDVKAILTRSTDVFVTIKGRMDIAKKEKADLFISLHCNSAAFENPRRASLSGTSVYVLGNSNANDNIDLAMRENSAILLEDDYKTTYKGFDNSPEYYIFTEINQSKMMGKSNTVANEIQSQLVSHAGLKNNRVNETSRLWLLLHSTMPAVLVEMDYICNPSREQFLNSESGQRQIAEAICKGVANYRRSLGHKVSGKPAAKPKSPAKPKSQPTPTTTPADDSPKTTATDPVIYKIQFLTDTTPIKNGSAKFKGLSPVDFYLDGSTYKFTYGNFTTLEAANKALKEVKKKFHDAFVIKTRAGVRIK